MFQYIMRRVVLFVPTLFGVLTLVFLILHATPGSPARRILGDYATAEAVADLEHQMGLDRPLHVQYGDFVWSYMKGDFGKSLRNRRPVIKEILKELPYTLQLTALGMVIAIVFGVGVGIISAVKPNSLLDNVGRVVALLGVSMPVFWSGMLLIIIFSLELRWFPIIGVGDPGDPLDLLHHLVLPALTVGMLTTGLIMRMTRASMLEVIGEDYIRTAYSKGLQEKRIYLKHALRNAAIPIVTIIGLNFGSLLGGAVLTETVFARHGIGKLVVDAILWKDYPVAQASIFVISLMFVIINLITDLLYGVLDPRIRYD
jgi:ABC-type dipeptide/oligopeptide/nickel transport system permease component